MIAKMNRTPLPGILVSALALSVAVTSPAVTQEVEEAPSTVNATYAAESATDALEPGEKIDNHATYISTWIPALGRYATDVLRPTYGDYYGFEYSTPKNAEMVAWFMFAYR